jgi:DnaJ-class molecular chaperone
MSIRLQPMPQIHTHYDNLKVARNAPPEIIRAAYKTLSQKFHPDRNPDKPNATRTFQLISVAYEVLSDPVKRKAHDEWIAAEEAKEKPADPALHTAHIPKAAQQGATGHMPPPTGFRVFRKAGRKERPSMNRLFKYCFWLLLPTLILLIVMAA